MEEEEFPWRRNMKAMEELLVDTYQRIPKAKWLELVEKEETDMFILGIRDEIVNLSLEICYANYLKKQAVPFTIHCAYLAWVKVLDIYYKFRDPGDTDDPKVKDSWKPDAEPDISVIDSWGTSCIQLHKDQPLNEKLDEEKVEEKIFVASPVHSLPPSSESESFTYGSYSTLNFETGEGEFYFPEMISDEASSESPRKKSIFSKTLSMSEKSLPWFKPTVPECSESAGVHVKKKVAAILPSSARDPSKQFFFGGREKRSSYPTKKWYKRKRSSQFNAYPFLENLKRLAVSYSVKSAKDKDQGKKKEKPKF